ncbi:HNH endonuclease domain-containing protein [Sulfurimonas sp. NWX79]|uniref:HNH endonuclease domain-containing protein n=1 Tax=Sulfurimonas sp. NWX79 TaxID=2925412 RepID=UPI003204F96F
MINIEALRQINYIIEYDSTSSTYKYVLLKSVINASQKYDHLINIENGRANIPLGLIIEQWIIDYMPFVFKNIAQQNNKSVLDRPITTIYDKIFELLNLDKSVEWEYAYIQFSKALQNPNVSIELSKEFFKLSKKIATKIVTMPMRYTGTSDYEFFTPNKYKFGEIKFSHNDIFNSNFLIVSFDTFSISEQHYNIFRYLGQTLYGTSTIISKWKQKTDSLNANQEVTKNIIDKLSGDTLEIRETNTIRNLLPDNKICVWSGKELRGDNYDVDHVLPFSVWFNNDLWNMLPTDRRLNQQQKKHKIPTRKLIEKRANIIINYWHDYQKAMPILFNSQLSVALLGQDSKKENNLELAIESLCKKSDYLIYDRGHEKFEI